MLRSKRRNSLNNKRRKPWRVLLACHELVEWSEPQKQKTYGSDKRFPPCPRAYTREIKMKRIPLFVVVILIAVFSLIAVLLGISIGYFFHQSADSKAAVSEDVHQKDEKWTCSMHPQIQKNKPGKCPICFMDLIPLNKNGKSSNTGKTELHLSPEAQQLAEIQTMPVVRKFVYADIKMTGKITMNEQLMAYITARMPGRIDRLFVNYTGIPVKKGDHMAEYYSPELLVAQRELLLAVKDLKKTDKDAFQGYGMSPEKMLKTVKKKLEFWGLTEQNVKKIIDTGEISQHVVLYAPVGGIVTQKNALEGKYFKTGDRLFTIADLSQVWVMLEAYESDINKLRYGQRVEFTSEAFPGEIFSGRISFIDPVLDPATRTVNVRVDASNPHGKLKPGMFIRAIVKTLVSADGKVVMDNSLAGKWISPMHPEIIKDGPGQCDICGMDLVKAESLGYVGGSSKDSEAPLVIPVTAPLITGKRAIVYVKKPSFYVGVTTPSQTEIFEGREVVLGPRCGDYYIVEKGLKAGEEVVVKGNFKIDSSLQIMAKPSMMAVESNVGVTSRSRTDKKLTVRDQEVAPTLIVPESFKKQLDQVYKSYFKIHTALSKDDLKKAKEAAEQLKNVDEIKTDGLSEEQMKLWDTYKKEIAKIAEKSVGSENIENFRANFANLSASVYLLTKQFGVSKDIKIKKFYCPMAFNNKGATWLQQADEVENPYFGAAMYRCGEKVEDINKEQLK